MSYAKRIHLIGIGGIGMSAIARILNREGRKVTGSDAKENTLMKELRNEGIECYVGHSEKNLGDCETVVYSSSIGSGNAELHAARKRGLRTMHRAEMLAELIGGKKSIAVTGAHGKTTTSALLALIFEKAGMGPTAAIGGEVLNFRSNALYGKGDYFILEADESDGSFLNFHTDKAVLLNIDREHFDYFKDMDNAVNIYRKFIENVKSDGTIYYNMEDNHINRLMDSAHRRKISFGIGKHADVRGFDVRQSGLKINFRCAIRGKVMPGEIQASLPGTHNAANALGAIAVAHDAGIGFDSIRDSMACYQGTKRRFEIKNTSGRFMVVEDYAHHPREIEAVLRAGKALDKNLIVVFQPHRYTRTKDLFSEFVNCFKTADYLILTDIYAAAEKKINGVSSKKLFREIKKEGVKAEYLRKDLISRRIREIAGDKDLVLVLGAGDINEVAKELAEGTEKSTVNSPQKKQKYTNIRVQEHRAECKTRKGGAFMDIEQKIKKIIKGKVAYNEPMSNHTSFRIGGPADIMVEPKEIEDIKNCVDLSRDKKIPLFILGRGTNLLVRSNGIRGMVLDMRAPSLKDIYFRNCRAYASSAVTLGELLNACSAKGLGGLEFLAGIPASVGGAVMTNAGARDYGEANKWHSIGDFIEEIKFINYAGMPGLLNRKDLNFGYKSLDLPNCVILEAKFLLNAAPHDKILDRCAKFLMRKKRTQEFDTASAGCIFKNPAEIDKSAGELIDLCGLKGAKVGDAAISEKHANFIVNTGSASSEDVLALIDRVREKIKNIFEIDLSLEIEIVG